EAPCQYRRLERLGPGEDLLHLGHYRIHFKSRLGSGFPTDISPADVGGFRSRARYARAHPGCSLSDPEKCFVQYRFAAATSAPPARGPLGYQAAAARIRAASPGGRVAPPRSNASSTTPSGIST